MALIQCIYCSSAADSHFSDADLHEILEVSCSNNAALGITGILLFEEGSFFQVLEGEAEIVDELFQKLQSDPRHSDVSMIISEPIEERSFGAWSMGHPSLTMSEIEAIPGLNDFFIEGRSYMNASNETVSVLLDAFREGKWHI